jgi:transposase InsO family protein
VGLNYQISPTRQHRLALAIDKTDSRLSNTKPGLIFHSDRGGQYISKSFVSLLKKNGMEQSLSASGKPYDNAVAESFFSIIKKEELYRHQYRSVYDFQESVANYIDYYNNTRVHSFLGYLSPGQFEAKFCEKNDNGRSI